MPYTPNLEIRDFWTREIEPTMKCLFDGKCQFPEIQQRYFFLKKVISATYANPLHISLHDEEPPDKTSEALCLPFGCRMNNCRPEVGIFVPIVRTIWRDARKVKYDGFRSRVQADLLIGFIHELDHIALDMMPNSPTLGQMIDCERVVWGSTCEYAIKPLVEIHRVEMCQSDLLYYSAWVQSGRNVNSESWKNFITGLYKTIRRG